MTKQSFVIHNLLYPSIEHLNNEDLGALFRASFLYHITGELPELTPTLSMAFSFFKTQFDYNSAKYQDVIVVRNQKNGSKGGRPKKEKPLNNNDKNKIKTQKTQWVIKNPTNPHEPKKADNVNVNVNDYGFKEVSTNQEEEISIGSYSTGDETYYGEDAFK